MSWEHPEPPVFDYWRGLALLTAVTVAGVLALYVLLT